MMGLSLLYISVLLFNPCHAVIEFLLHPQPQAVLLGDDVILHCAAQDYPSQNTLAYRWYLNATQVTEAVPSASQFLNHSLFIPRIQQDGLGSYSCAVWPEAVSETEAVSSRNASVVQAYIQPFYMHPSSVTSDYLDPVSLDCITGLSAPSAAIWWELNGARFEAGMHNVATYGPVQAGGATQQSMTLQLTAFKNYTGSFRCVAYNYMTQETVRSRDATLVVRGTQHKPYLADPLPESQISAEDLPLMTHCAIYGDPTPVIRWYRNGVAIISSSQNVVFGNGSLLIRKLSIQDEGQYWCTGTNSLGNVTSNTMNLTTAYLNTIFKMEPTDINATAGLPLTLTCSPPESRPEAKVIWYKDGNSFSERSGEFEVSIRNLGDLYFRKARFSDDGRYFCVAINHHSVPMTRTSRIAQLRVFGSPEITEPPLSKELKKAEALTLTCKVQGNPEPTIVWYRDSDQVQPDERVYYRDGGQELVIAPVNKADEGLYKCVVSNSYGSTESSAVLVRITVPPEVLTGLKDVTAHENSTVKLSCKIYAAPPPVITWYKDGQVITGTSRLIIGSDGLLITSVQSSDEGLYQCMGQNKAGSRQTEGRLTVLASPRILTVPSNRTVTENDDMILTCQVSGKPAPSVVWRHNGSTLPEGAKLHKESSFVILSLTAVRPSFNGEYTCIASNSLGSAQASWFLQVLVKPVVLNITGNLIVPKGQDLTLTCEAGGVPAPDLAWYFKGQRLEPTPNGRVKLLTPNRLQVLFTNMMDDGTYHCQATNDVGRDEKTVKVHIIDVPRPPVLDLAFPMSKSSVNLTWTPTDQDLYTDVDYYVVRYKTELNTHYMVYRDDIPGSLTSVEVMGLEADTEYVFTVSSRNTVGTGAPSSVRQARTLKTAPPAPRNLKVVQFTSRNITVRWEQPVGGNIKLYQVHYSKKDSSRGPGVTEVSSHVDQETVITGLSPDTLYQLRVRGATTQNGVQLWGQFTEYVTARTEPEAPSAPPSGVQVVPIATDTLLVSWVEIPPGHLHGDLKNYIILSKSLTLSAPSFREENVPPGVASYNLTDLSPWNQYEVRVIGLNVAGRSPSSAPGYNRTFPAAPSGSPVNLTGEAMSSTSVRVRWQPVELPHRNSIIARYDVSYWKMGTTQKGTLRMNGSESLTANISDLEPWTFYHVQVRAFTQQVEDGQGPYSDPVVIRTGEDLPGTIRNRVIPSVASVAIWWDSPEPATGDIQYYQVQCWKIEDPDVTTIDVTSSPSKEAESHVNSTDVSSSKATAHTETLRRKKRSVEETYTAGPASSSPGTLSTLTNTDNYQIIKNVQTNQTHVTLEGLEPGTLYQLSITAFTSVGPGPADSIYFNTSAGTPTIMASTATQEMVTFEMTSDPSISEEVFVPSTRAAGFDQQKMIVIIVGSVLGGLVVIILLIIVILLCCRKKDGKKPVYFIPPTAFRLKEHEKQVKKNQAPKPPTTSGTATVMSDSDPEPASSQPNLSTVVEGSSINIAGVTEEESNLHPVRVTQARSLDDLSSDNPSRSNGQLRASERGYMYQPQGATGVDNPVFDGRDSIYLSADPPNVEIPGYSQGTLSLQRRNRMRGQIAAAIAAQRNQTTSVFDDTDSLIHNDSVVVYNERTAL